MRKVCYRDNHFWFKKGCYGNVLLKHPWQHHHHRMVLSGYDDDVPTQVNHVPEIVL